MYTIKHLKYNEKEIFSILRFVAGVNYKPEQIKIVWNKKLLFACTISGNTDCFVIEEFLEYQGYSRSYSDLKPIYNKPWWIFGRKIVGFEVNAKTQG